jgi:hypothetical protein
MWTDASSPIDHSSGRLLLLDHHNVARYVEGSIDLWTHGLVEGRAAAACPHRLTDTARRRQSHPPPTPYSGPEKAPAASGRSGLIH